MADEVCSRATKRSLSETEPTATAAESDGLVDKKLKVEQTKSPPKEYKEIRKVLRSLTTQMSKPNKDMSKILPFLEKLRNICCQSVPPLAEEVPTAAMVIQMHLKQALFTSENVKDEDNVRNFLNGLEDGSASRSDKDDSVFFFVANLATEIWYRWDESERQWFWTPEQTWHLWMPCSSTVVSDGRWKDEIPAPENVEIIKYLDTVQPTPSDEVYLSDSFNVAQLFDKLVTLEESEAKEHVVAITTALKDQSIVSEDYGNHIKGLKESLAKVLNDVAG